MRRLLAAEADQTAQGIHDTRRYTGASMRMAMEALEIHGAKMADLGLPTLGAELSTCRAKTMAARFGCCGAMGMPRRQLEPDPLLISIGTKGLLARWSPKMRRPLRRIRYSNPACLNAFH